MATEEREESDFSPLLIEEQRPAISQIDMCSVVFYKFVRPCVAEMIATMSFVFVDVCSVSTTATSGGDAAGFTHGFILFVLVASTATVRYRITRHFTKPSHSSDQVFRFQNRARVTEAGQTVDLGSSSLNKMDEDHNFQIEELPSRSRMSSLVFYKFIRPCIAEMTATMCFVFVDVCSSGTRNVNAAAFTHGFILFVLVASTATVRETTMYKGSQSSQSYIPLKDTRQEGCPPPKPDPGTSAYFFQHFIRPLFAELIGVVFFVFVGVTCLYPAQTGSSRTAIALTHGFILFVLVAVTAEASGGHLNPAVTLALTICRGLKPILAPFYVLAQLLGGIIGAALAKAALTSANYDTIKGGVHHLGDGIDPGQGILAEAVATSILVLVVLMVAFDDNNKSVLAPLAIGLTVAGCIFSIGSISGASMNPARSFGPALVRNYWEYHYVYWVGPILGSMFSSLMYGLVLASPSRLWLPFYEPVE